MNLLHLFIRILYRLLVAIYLKGKGNWWDLCEGDSPSYYFLYNNYKLSRDSTSIDEGFSTRFCTKTEAQIVQKHLNDELIRSIMGD